MRVLSASGSRRDVAPVVGLAVRLRSLGAQVRVCAPPDSRSCPGAWPGWPLPSSTPSPLRPEVCDVLVATGVMPGGVRL